jgi:hypothetical protein
MIALLALAASVAAAAPEDYKALPDAVRAEVLRVEQSARRSETFKRLLAENDGLERATGTLPAPEFVRFEARPRRLVYDAKRLGRATEWELQLAEARELARASMGLPVTLVEAEAAARQKELAFALELAEAEPAFSKEWSRRGAKAKAAADAAANLDSWTRAHLPDQPLEPHPALPDGELDRAALFAALLAQGPARFYDGVGALLPPEDEPCRLAEVADFTALHARELRALKPEPGESFTAVGGQRYPSRVVRAAQALADAGGPAFAKEAVGPREREAAELSTRLRHQLRWPVEAAP